MVSILGLKFREKLVSGMHNTYQPILLGSGDKVMDREIKLRLR